jgi:hypothetical protein
MFRYPASCDSCSLARLYGRTKSAFESKSCILTVPCAARGNVSVVTRLNTDSRRNRGRGLLWSCSVGGRQGGHFRADERRDSKNCKTSLLAHRPKLSDCEFSSNADNTVYLRRANSVFIRSVCAYKYKCTQKLVNPLITLSDMPAHPSPAAPSDQSRPPAANTLNPKP